MSQSSHRIYKELIPLEKKFRYYNRVGFNGVQSDLKKRMILGCKYDYLKKKLEYETQDKYDNYQDHIIAITPRAWGMITEQEKLLNNKMKNDIELVQLRRNLVMLKIQLI